MNRPTRDGPVAVLVNPGAGRGRRAAIGPAVLSHLGAGGRPVTVLQAATRAEALAASRRAVAARPTALVVVGGDGTVHIALQAVADTGVPLGIVPAGTGNDFAVEVGVPADPLTAAAAIAEGLDAGRVRSLDLGRVVAADGRECWFGGVVGAGFDTIVNERANRMRFPRGPRRYDLAIVAELVRLRSRTYTLTLDGVEQRIDAVIIAVGNTASYGGRLRVCPAADPTDGLLDVVVGLAMSRATLVRIKPSVYRGSHIRHPLVRQYRARSVQLAGADITTYADGEPAFPLPVTIMAVPGALTVVG